MRHHSSASCALLVVPLVLSACDPSSSTTGDEGTSSGTSPVTTYVPVDPTIPRLIGAGDIATCGQRAHEETAKLLDRVFATGVDGVVFAAGDIAYGSGTNHQFNYCYDPTWGRHKHRTRPAVGNHEYMTSNASGYFEYFGASAGAPDKGYYSYDLGTWHVVVLNTNCGEIGGCERGSSQEEWLRSDLAAHPNECVVAYGHHPRFSSGAHGDDSELRDLWRTLYEHGAELFLVGHDHDYERFAPQDQDGNFDPAFGIREFVVGTGGRNFRRFGDIKLNSEVRNSDTHGVLELVLKPGGYDWQFLPVDGKSFTDSGSARCHGAPAPQVF